jgi:hypothetical protein
MLRSASKLIWNKQLVSITDGYGKATVLTASLNPVGKLDYKLEGHVTLMSSPILDFGNEGSETLHPTLEIWVLDEAGVDNWRQGQFPPTKVYGSIRVPSIRGQTTNFSLQNFDHDGSYSFLFFALDNQPLLPMLAQHAEVRISLTETWTET